MGFFYLLEENDLFIYCMGLLPAESDFNTASVAYPGVPYLLMRNEYEESLAAAEIWTYDPLHLISMRCPLHHGHPHAFRCHNF